MLSPYSVVSWSDIWTSLGSAERVALAGLLPGQVVLVIAILIGFCDDVY